ncbi:TetR family transcriptional regulator [Streptomyces sp. SID3343]|uniref:TetR family transcriptional regulator n=1 Tax=Streptomyces sp. SID3343 TaxID=2690260 RepID=UPI00136BFA88|nr:TetR family transcriptional regulator [Streptomyces sp. SID3343]MYV99361.1 TetR family transcriptional regulator [Streptomyces sp. SID3343]
MDAAAAARARRAGRPSLTERRKADTRTEVSRAAVRLFAERGFDDTTVEDIAAAVGMALRTFYRYFRSKEETVAPVLAAGTSDWVERLAAADPDLPLLAAMDLSYRASMRHSRDVDGVDDAQLRVVLRTADGHPALRAVWLAVHHDCEQRLRPVIAARLTADPDGLAVHLAAGAANTAVRIAMQRWATEDGGADDAADRVADALSRIADGGLLHGGGADRC